ncbi:hypothetical protein KIN20_023793 [Parelaphostrongylus tenuis]|uniref:Uncharacterized protein n=1 Tax=Parelaphostrongylus tenuis TaxID=148309 RepID=A0AAD5N6X0_PARTN|nr:hypothetical protein KIN20_015802 [Parelaphostrongylus tenuis]KAJ1363846.1 hypothetical protein KIN20_023793 [Parelaphostrongylus tenuis]
MRTFVFLLCIGSVLSFPGYNNDVDEYTDYDGDDSSEEHECSHCEFLKGLPKKALSEYYKIAQVHQSCPNLFLEI